MKELVNDINKLHVNYDVLAYAVLHLTAEEQVKVNKLVSEAIGLPVHATASSIKRERQKRVDGLDEYGVILDAFAMLKKVTDELENALDGSDNGAKESYEALADAQMLIGSIEHDR